jgi:hypothetical protein
MSVSSVGPGAVQSLQAAAPANQLKAPDRPNDGDGDAGDAPKVKASPTPGTGALVDKTA